VRGSSAWQDRLRLQADGRVVVERKTAWHDGMTQLVFEPLELLATVCQAQFGREARDPA
jgi:hypothetical protein